MDNDFIVEHSETTIPTIEIHTTSDDTNIQFNNPIELLSDTSESQVQCPQQDPQTTQPMIQQQPYIHLEKMSLQSNEKVYGDHIQHDLQNPNPTLDNKSTVHRNDSNAILVPIRLVTEQDPQHLTRDPSFLSTNNTTKTQSQKKPTTSRNYDPPSPPPEMIHLLLLLPLNNHVPLKTKSMYL